MRTRKSPRLSGYDYSRDAMYFITTNSKDFTPHFGEVKNGEMYLNKYGEIARQQWLWLAEQYPYVELGEFIIMPDHVHGIIGINSSLRSQLKIKPLTQLIGAYKTTVAKKIHLAGNSSFSWHRSFYDKIILDEESLRSITKYIKDNPKNV